MAFKVRTIGARGWRGLSVAIAALVGAVIAWHLVSGYFEFRWQLVGMYRIKLNDSRGEVMYRLGSPPSVLGPLEDTVFDGKVVGQSRAIFEVGGKAGDINTVPANKSVNDYQVWVYAPDPMSTDLIVEFDKAGRVEAITCTAHGDNPFACGPVPHVWNGADEEKILKLGKPSTNSVDGVTKTIEYADIGVRYYLTKGAAYAFTLKRPTGSNGAVLRRHLRTILP